MAAGYQAVLEGKGLRETSRLYNVPVETLRRLSQPEGLSKPEIATVGETFEVQGSALAKSLT